MTMHSELLDALNVSRETEQDLNAFAQQLLRWNAKINLISRRTADEIWTRHIEDSAQLLLWAPEKIGLWLDLGSGGGLPGLVIAILGKGSGRVQHVTLVESDQRKCAFLREVTRNLGLPVTVRMERIETLAPQPADVISARALADLPKLFAYSFPHIHGTTRFLLSKGANHAAEIAAARSAWSFDCTLHPSRTESTAAIVEVRNLLPIAQKEAQ